MTTDVSVACQQSTRERRSVSSGIRRQAFAEYGLTYPPVPGAFEVDHLIPLELGGDNTIANLWPEAAEPTPGFQEKDKVENYLHHQVCAGILHLADAQRLIATDWLAVWKRMEGGASTTPMDPRPVE
jgi:hypothetical protein